MLYADVTRTTHIATFYSGIDQSGWKVNEVPIPSLGYAIAAGDTVAVEFTPESGSLTDDEYFLVLDFFDGSEFININKSTTIEVRSDFDYSCGEYTNVPIIKDLAIEVELEEFTEQFGSRERTRRTIRF